MSGLARLRRDAQAMVKRLQQAGRRELLALERQIAALERERQGVLREIGAAVGQGSTRGRPRGRRPRVDWATVFARLPKGTFFKASDLRKLVPGVAAGTLSQRLTGWVREKKLKRTGSRRGTRYTKAA